MKAIIFIGIAASCQDLAGAQQLIQTQHDWNQARLLCSAQLGFSCAHDQACSDCV